MFKTFLLLCLTLSAEAKIVKETVTSTIKNVKINTSKTIITIETQMQLPKGETQMTLKFKDNDYSIIDTTGQIIIDKKIEKAGLIEIIIKTSSIFSLELNVGNAEIKTTAPLKNILCNAGRLEGSLQNIIGHAEFNLGYGSLKLKYAKKESPTRLITLVIGSGDAEIYLPKNAHPYLQKKLRPYSNNYYQ